MSEETPSPPESCDDTKVCPYCAETIKAAATVCRFCNRNLPGSASLPVAPASVIVTPKEQENKGFTIFVAIVVIVIVFYCIKSCNDQMKSPSMSSSASPSYRSSTRKVSQENWDAVTALFEKEGASVGPRNQDFPDFMDVSLPSSMAMDITERQAKEMALMGRNRLGEGAVVRIKSPSGQLLAQAASWD